MHWQGIDPGALLMVDGIQGAGVCPLNVNDDGIDILACGGFKMNGQSLFLSRRDPKWRTGNVTRK